MTTENETAVHAMWPGQAGICYRRAVAEARGMPNENDPTPVEPEVENRRRAALRLTPLVIERMQEDGWQLEATRPAETTNIKPGVPVKVPMRRVMYRIPDDADQTSTEAEQKPEPERFEVLIRIPGPGRRVSLNGRGAANAYYDEIAAVACAQTQPMNILVVAYDSDEGSVSQHRINRRSIDEMKEQWSENMGALADTATKGDELPAPQHEYGAKACQTCVYKQSCPTQQTSPEEEDPDLDEEAFADALENWLAADEKIRDLRNFEKVREGNRDQMVKMLTDNNLTEMSIHDNSGNLRLVKHSSYPRNSPDLKKLQEALTPSEYDELVPKTTSNRFTVSKGK